MKARIDNTARKGLRQWWLTPQRSGLQRLIQPWEYRHLRFFGITRVAGGSVAAVAGFICLFQSDFGWAAFFGAVGVLGLSAGCWFLTIARSASARA